MKILDITLPVTPHTFEEYGDAPPVSVVPLSAAVPSRTNGSNFSMLHLPTHCGTHVDAPRHVDNDGSDVASLPLDTLCGPVRVVAVRGRGPAIEDHILRELDLTGVERLLLKTDHPSSTQGSPQNQAYLTGDAARYLRTATEVRLLGIDCSSVDARAEDAEEAELPAHRALLDGPDPVFILEGIDLTAVDPGEYLLWCLPLKLIDGDGAPARTVLVQT
jgi:arylformamidase